jgi:hypothetical protein
MTNTYTWNIDSLECTPFLDGKTNVVSTINWRVDGTNGTNNAVVYGQQTLIYEAETTFIDYAELTKDVVIKWVKDSLGADTVADIEKNLYNQLAILANPPIVTPKLPWA